MEAYKQEFIEFMVDSQVLKFGEFTLKSGRKSPFFMNAGGYVTGAQLKKMVKFSLRKGALQGLTEFYQYSKGFEINFDYDEQQLLSMSLDGKPIEDEKLYSVGITSFHFQNLKEFLDVSVEEVSKNKEPKVVATKSADVLEEYFSKKELVKVAPDRRLCLKQYINVKN